MNLNSDQLRAVEMARGRRLSIVSGGAGTGKTTVIKEIAQACAGAVLVAPTGKAAARLREASGHETATIHRLLGYNGAGFQVKKLTCPVKIGRAHV